MPQTLSSLTLELQPASVDRVRDAAEGWRDTEERAADRYSELRTRVPGLHFFSITIFADAHYDPVLVIEANMDDEPEHSWRQLAEAYAQPLQSMLRGCKRPPGRAGTLFDAATRRGAISALATFLNDVSCLPIVAHQGHRGRDRSRIEREAALFRDAQDLLNQPRTSAPATTIAWHAELRAALLVRHPWLGEPAPTRIAWTERLRDALNLTCALATLLLGLSLPGLLVSPLGAAFVLPGTVVIGLAAIAALRRGITEDVRRDASRAKAEFTLMLRHAAPVLAKPGCLLAASALFVAASGLIVSAIASVAAVALTGAPLAAAWPQCVRAIALGFTSIGATGPVLLLWIRRVETADPAQDEPLVVPADIAEFERAEDQIAQNHMTSIVPIKPGLLRAVVLRAGLRGLGRLLRVLATDGYLGSMRTIHFAQWSIVGNGSRLLFLSNFDGSWDSYLDDFIEKAHGGLSLAWGSCVGFPPCRFLVLKGASQSRLFKAWARRSMRPASLWFSAYPLDTVGQIERRAVFADGLRRPTLTAQEAAAWIRTL